MNGQESHSLEGREQGQGAFLFGSHIRRELVLADLIRESLQQSKLESCSMDLINLQAPRVLGPLELEVMEVVWRKGEATVREVQQIFLRKREIAYTTILTELRNLYRKHFLTRKRGEVGFIYYPRQTREEFIEARVGQIVDLLLDQFPGPALAHLLKRMEREQG